MHEGFEFWVADVDGKPTAWPRRSTGERRGVADRAADQVEAAYWTDVGTKEHLRWVMPEPEDGLLDALARLHVAGQDGIVDEARLVGMFRAHGLLAPVWDLPLGTGAEALEDPARRSPRTSPQLWPTTRTSPPSSAPLAPGSPTGRSPSGDPARGPCTASRFGSGGQRLVLALARHHRHRGCRGRRSRMHSLQTGSLVAVDLRGRGHSRDLPPSTGPARPRRRPGLRSRRPSPSRTAARSPWWGHSMGAFIARAPGLTSGQTSSPAWCWSTAASRCRCPVRPRSRRGASTPCSGRPIQRLRQTFPSVDAYVDFFKAPTPPSVPHWSELGGGLRPLRTSDSPWHPLPLPTRTRSAPTAATCS